MDIDSNATFNPVYHERIDGSSIRLLRFSKSRNGGFTGQLKKFALADAPRFFSASYTWGARVYSNTTIKLKRGQLPILEGLLPLLRMASEHGDFYDDDWWWIDSLSINLADGQEREQQVRIMADIYQRARRAIIWLGEEVENESDCRGAIDFMHYLQRMQPVLNNGGTHTAIARASLRSSDMATHWAAVSNLLARPWWTRVWTLQEMILPQEAKFYCGDAVISRGDFKTAMYSIFLCSVENRDMKVELIPRKAFDTAFNRRRVHQWHLNPKSRGINLVACLAYFGNHSASDSRDRIYSVLGLVTDRDRRLIGNPEYKTSVQHQYARLVRSFYNEYQNLDIICFAHNFNRWSGPGDSGNETAVPSWTPDWRVYTEYASPVPLMASQSASEYIGNFRPLHGQKWKAAYDAPGQQLRERANVRFDEDLKEMWCDGVILDTIENLGSLEGCDPRCRSFVCAQDEPLHGLLQNPLSNTPRTSDSPDAIALLNSIARSLALNRQDKYLRFVAPPRYTSDFLVLCAACLDTETLPSSPGASPDPTFATWFQHNRHLRLVPSNHTLETLIQMMTSSTHPTLFPSLPSPSRRSTNLSDSLTMYPPRASTDADSDDADTFLSRFLDTTRKKSRRLMVTRDGHVGMAPCRARPGDVVAVLFGCSIPLVLRRAGDKWWVVGEAFMDGYMEGEVESEVRAGWRRVEKSKLV